MGRLFVPALELAARPFAATEAQAFLHEILVPILQREPAGARVYGTPGVIDATDLVPALQLLRDAGPDALALLVPEVAEDLESYRVQEHHPLEGTFDAASVLTTPAPSRGGAVVRRGLAALDGHDRGRPGSADEARALAAALAVAYGPEDGSGARPDRHDARLGGRRRGRRRCDLLDARSGSGVFRHGFQLNNMLGELDVIGHVSTRGRRPPPEHDDADDRPARRERRGSSRQRRLGEARRAIAQVTASVLGRAYRLRSDLRPRLHVDGDIAHVEGGLGRVRRRSASRRRGRRRPLGRPNLFFGGRSAVERRSNGTLGAAGDPRRGGHGVVVA